MLSEKAIKGHSGWVMIFMLLAMMICAILMLVFAIRAEDAALIIAAALVMVVDMVLWAGLTVVNPNEAKVVQLFGVYKGSIKEQGLWWVNALTSRRRVSLRIRNFESSRLKVNDHDGNPIEIAAVVVWRVVETAEAVFHVDD